MGIFETLLAEISYSFAVFTVIGIFLIILLMRNFHWWQWYFATVYCHICSGRIERGCLTYKKSLFSDLSDIQSIDKKLKDIGLIRILEIGCGHGTNFMHYPKNSRLICYEPNVHFHPHLLKHSYDHPNVKLERLVLGGGENLVGTEDNSIDVVVTTMVLCSVSDTEKVLKEIQRVLCKGGKYYFLEHVKRPPGTFGSFVQTTGTPPWKYVFHCDPIRESGEAILKAGFSDVKLNYVDIEEVYGYMVKYCALGVATN